MQHHDPARSDKRTAATVYAQPIRRSLRCKGTNWSNDPSAKSSPRHPVSDESYELGPGYPPCSDRSANSGLAAIDRTASELSVTGTPNSGQCDTIDCILTTSCFARPIICANSSGLTGAAWEPSQSTRACTTPIERSISRYSSCTRSMSWLWTTMRFQFGPTDRWEPYNT